MTTPPTSTPESAGEMIALALLGKELLHAIRTTHMLGHSRLVHTNMYRHGTSTTELLIDAVIEGRIGEVLAALDEWRADTIPLATQVARERMKFAPTERAS